MAATTERQAGSQPDERQQALESFLKNLEGLGKDTGALAVLKRGAGRPLEEYPRALTLIYRLLRGLKLSRWDEEGCMLLATLYPLQPGSTTGSGVDLGCSLRRLAVSKPNMKGGLDRRMTVLLDCDRQDLPFRLRQMVRLLVAHEQRIDWRQLLLDLCRWGMPGRPVQKQWARSYFGAASPGTESPDVAASDLDIEAPTKDEEA